MDTIQLKSKNNGFFFSVKDDCIMGVLDFYVPIVTVSEAQEGIFGHTLMSFKDLVEEYLFPKDKKYDMIEWIRQYPQHRDTVEKIEWYGEIEDPDRDEAIQKAINLMDEESGIHE